MFFYRLAVDHGAIRTAKIFKEGVSQYRHQDRMLSANSQIINLDIVMWLASNCGSFLGELNLLQHQAIHT